MGPGQGSVQASRQLLDSGGDSGDERRAPIGFLDFQVALIIRYFAGLNFVNNAEYCEFVKALIPKGKVSRFFNLVKTFPGCGSPATKFLTSVIVLPGRGRGSRLCTGQPSSNQLI